MVMVDMDTSGLQVDSQHKSVGLRSMVTWHIHTLNQKISQWLCHNISTKTKKSLFSYK